VSMFDTLMVEDACCPRCGAYSDMAIEFKPEVWEHPARSPNPANCGRVSNKVTATELAMAEATERRRQPRKPTLAESATDFSDLLRSEDNSTNWERLADALGLPRTVIKPECRSDTPPSPRKELRYSPQCSVVRLGDVLPDYPEYQGPDSYYGITECSVCGTDLQCFVTLWGGCVVGWGFHPTRPAV